MREIAPGEGGERDAGWEGVSVDAEEVFARVVEVAGVGVAEGFVEHDVIGFGELALVNADVEAEAEDVAIVHGVRVGIGEVEGCDRGEGAVEVCGVVGGLGEGVSV